MPNQVVNPTIIPSTVPIPFPSARDPAPKVLQLKVAVPKTGQKNALPRGDATEMPVDGVAVPKTASRVDLRIVLREPARGPS